MECSGVDFLAAGSRSVAGPPFIACTSAYGLQPPSLR
jgi:hypothetical protein